MTRYNHGKLCVQRTCKILSLHQSVNVFEKHFTFKHHFNMDYLSFHSISLIDWTPSPMYGCYKKDFHEIAWAWWRFSKESIKMVLKWLVICVECEVIYEWFAWIWSLTFGDCPIDSTLLNECPEIVYVCMSYVWWIWRKLVSVRK